eukprot:11187538-Lingulodinium_polyedra.AAC.1
MRAGSGAAGAKSSCKLACVAMPRPQRSSAPSSHSLARRLAKARSTREGVPEVGKQVGPASLK